MNRPRVIVVGGGLAGLSAAIEAADLGASVTLFERRPRLGGATWSFEHNGRTYDNGQHLFLRCCTAYRGFLDRIGAGGDVELQGQLALPVVGRDGDVSWLRRTDRRAPLHLTASLLRYRPLAPMDRWRVARAALALARVDRTDPATDASTFGEWLSAHGQSPRAVDAFWDLIVRPTVNLPSAEASLSMAATVFQIGFLDDPTACDIGLPRVPLRALHAEPAARVLDGLGATIHVGRDVRAVEPGEDGATVVLDDERADADAVIVAVPHDRVDALLPPLMLGVPHDRVGSLGASAIVNVHLTYDRRVLPHPMVAVLDPMIQFAFDRSAAAGVDEGQQVAVSLSAADEHLATPSATLVERVTDAMKRSFADARDARVVDALVTREPRATFRAVAGAGASRPPATTQSPFVFVAGAWTDTGWPATMEGAVRSGLCAARAALARVRVDDSYRMRKVAS
jgi:squalene-associated FAD-dependent desaturase